MILMLFHLSVEFWAALLCLVFAVSIWENRKYNSKPRKALGHLLITNTLLLACDIAATICDGTQYALSSVLVWVGDFGVYFFQYLICIYVSHYVYAHIKANGGKPKKAFLLVVLILQIIATIGLIVSQFTGIYYSISYDNTYVRGPLFVCGIGFAIVSLVICVLYAVKYRHYIGRRSFLAIVSLIVFSLALLLVQIFFYGLSLVNIGISFSLILLFFAYEKESNIKQREQQERVTAYEYEAQQNKSAVLMAQLKPYFMSRSLVSIHEWCKSDPKKAAKGIEYLNSYIRETFVLLESDEYITLSQEIELLGFYLGMQELAYPGEIQTHFDVENKNLIVPPMTLLPVIEFMVAYEFQKFAKEGNIWIETKSDDENDYILIRDDGSGHSFSVIEQDDSYMLELDIVKKRLDILMGGTITVESIPNEGTNVVITLPKKEKSNQ